MDRLRCFAFISSFSVTTSRFASVICAAILLVTMPLGHAAKLEKIQTIEGITEYQLSNGLQVLLFPDQSKDTTTVNITYKVGSKHENYGETGMAHLLEHLLFKGSKKFADITKDLKAMGADYNGTTSFDRTNYFETFKATDKNLMWALDMEADRMVNSFVSAKDLESEMTVVRNEFERSENSPWAILRQRIMSVALDWHNYSNSPIGARSDIENVKIENLQAFYKKYYQPDNATLIVAGKFDEELALKTIKKTFGKIKKPKRILPEFYTLDPVQDGNREITLRRVGSEQVIASVYRVPPGSHSDFAALSVLSEVLGSEPSGRLHKNLNEKKLASFTAAFAYQQREPGLFFAVALGDLNTDIEASKKSLLETVETIKDKPITAEELERAKRSILKNIELAFNNSQNISVELSEWIGIGDWRLMFIERDRIEAVTQEDVQRVAEYYLIESNRTFGQFIPTEAPVRAEIPEAPNVAEIVEGYKGKKTIVQGEAFDASLENIAKREIRTNKGGIQISAVPIKTRGESVFLEARFGIGTESSLDGKAIAREFMADMLMMGAKNYTREQISDQLDILKAKGGFSSNPQAVLASFETTRENLPKLISLIHEVLTTATFPEKEFELLKSQQLTLLTSSITQPRSLAFSSFYTALNKSPKGSLHYYYPIEEKISTLKSTKLSDVKKLYSDVMGASNVQIGIAGDFDSAAITKLIFDKFSSWKNPSPYQYTTFPFQDVEKVLQEIETPDKKNAVFVAGKNIPITNNHEDAAAMHVATRIIGGGSLSSRLADRIRKKDGLSYGVGAVARIPNMDKNGQWIAYAISAPQNTEKVEAAFKEEMTKVFNDGVTNEELTSAIDSLLDEAKVSRSDNQTLARSVRDLLFENSSIENEIEFQKKLRNVTVDQVNAVIKKYLSTDDMTIIKAGDFANATKE